MDLNPTIISSLPKFIYFGICPRVPELGPKMWSKFGPICLYIANATIFTRSVFPHINTLHYITLRYCYVRNNESSGLSKFIYFAIGLRGLILGPIIWSKLSFYTLEGELLSQFWTFSKLKFGPKPRHN